MVLLSKGTKRKVSEMVDKCQLGLNGSSTWENLNILPLVSYDVLISMDWLETYNKIGLVQ